MMRVASDKHSTEERFWDKVEKGNSCWLWIGKRMPNGYARFKVGGCGIYAHRFAYELLVGPIPEGLQIDHLCRVRHCVNPRHLEPVTQRENKNRGLKGRATEHCPKGHAYDVSNTYWRKDRPNNRECKTCRAQRKQAHYITLAESLTGIGVND